MPFEAITDRVGWIPGGVNTGVIRLDDRQVAIIDAGINETAGKKVIKTVRGELGSEIVAILTTHAHADHFGANAAIVKRTGAEVYAPAVEAAVLEFPLLQPAMLFGGADPLDGLRTGFLLAHPSPVDQVIRDDRFTVGGVEVEVVPLWGHSPRQVGFLVDGVFFAADVVLPESVLGKYRIPYLFSLSDHLEALERCTDVQASCVVPGHGSKVDDLTERRDANLAAIQATGEVMLAAAQEPSTLDSIMSRTLQAMGAQVSDAPGYYLLQPTIAAFLAHLERVGEVRHEVLGNTAIWVRV